MIIDIYRPSKIPPYKELQISFKISLFHKYLIKETIHPSNSKFLFKFRARIYIAPTLYYVKACGQDTLHQHKTLLHLYLQTYYCTSKGKIATHSIILSATVLI